MFADTIQQYGTVDILINNAGLQKDSPFETMTLEQWNFVISVNLTGQFLCAQGSHQRIFKKGSRSEKIPGCRKDYSYEQCA